MNRMNWPGWLLFCLLLSACATPTVVSPKVVTVEVNRFIRETVIVVAPTPKPVIVEVTRIVEKVIVVTPNPPPIPELVVTRGVPLPLPLSRHTATWLKDGRILFAGGSRSGDEQLANVAIFDPTTGSFSQAAPLSTARHQHSATLLNDGRVLVVGGYAYPQQWLTDAEIYDPGTNQWSVLPPIYSHGVEHTATLLKDGRVLVIGGCIGSGVCTDQVEIFDPVTNTWSEQAPLPTDYASHTATLLDDGWVLVAGGAGAAGPFQGADALLYDPTTNRWAATSKMVVPRNQHASVKLADGRVLIAGGVSNGDTPTPILLSQAEIYDPYSNTWSPAGQLSQARLWFVMAALPDGKVVALGGSNAHDCCWNDNSFPNTVEVYDPASNTWHTAGQMNPPGINSAFLLLSDGRIWVTGGRAVTDHFNNTWLVTIHD